jgi:uncharacterized protein (DUF2235 family)
LTTPEGVEKLLEAKMIRNVVLLDGTWNTPRSGTNVCKLSREAEILSKLILPEKNGVAQNVKYFQGVGSDGLALERLLGGAIGIGLRKIVQDAYNWVIENYEHDQELFIYGFSRGAYAARALAGLIGASGIPKSTDPKLFDIMWTNYRARKAMRDEEAAASGGHAFTAEAARIRAGGKVHSMNRIKCLGVRDTVGSYGVPAGIGLAALGRYVTQWVFGFQDTKFGKHIDHGLHAIGIDERRRPFTPTFWTVEKGHPQPKNVEQTWFAGVHCNVGGGYPDKGLSDLALLWMIARTKALTDLGFDVEAVKSTLRPDVDGEIYDSAKGWLVDSLFPHSRQMFSPDALSHSLFSNAGDPQEEHINERVHWSVLAKLGRPCTIFGKAGTAYDPPNLPAEFKKPGKIPPQVQRKIAGATPEELELLPQQVAALVPEPAAA